MNSTRCTHTKRARQDNDGNTNDLSPTHAQPAQMKSTTQNAFRGDPAELCQTMHTLHGMVTDTVSVSNRSWAGFSLAVSPVAYRSGTVHSCFSSSLTAHRRRR